MSRFELLRFSQMVQQRAADLGYGRITQLQMARISHPCGDRSLRAQAHQVVPYPTSSATTGDAA